MRGRDGRRRGAAECDAYERFQRVMTIPSSVMHTSDFNAS